MTVKIGIETIYDKASGASGYLYALTAYIPPSTSAASTSTCTMTVSVSSGTGSSSTVFGTSNYSFTFSPVPTLAAGEMIGFFFPPNFIGKY